MNVIHNTRAEVPAAGDDRRSKRRDDRSEAILDAAMRLVETSGLEALTLARVADALGYVTTAIYRYFPSKDALLAALQRRAIAEIQAHFDGRVTALREHAAGVQPATLALACLLELADLYVALPSSHPRSWHFVAILLGDPRPLLSDEEALRTAPLLVAFLAAVGVLFERAAHEKALNPGSAQDRVLAYWAALHGAACMEKMRRIAPALPSAEAIGRGSARSLLASWGASSARLAAASNCLESMGSSRRV